METSQDLGSSGSTKDTDSTTSEENNGQIRDKDAAKDRAFTELYTQYKEKLVGHQFKFPRLGSEYHRALIAARQMVDELGGDYNEFLRNEFKIYEYHSRGRKRKLYPAAKWLTLPATRERYVALLKRRRFDGLSYKVGGGWFTVKKTRRRYPIEQARADIRHDNTANYVYKIAFEQKSLKVKRRLWESCCYLLAKQEYRAEMIPSIVYNWIKENVKGVINEKNGPIVPNPAA